MTRESTRESKIDPTGDGSGDSRRHRRFTVDVEARVTTAQERRIAARTRDVSRTGICLVSDTLVATGTSLRVDLVLAFGDNAFSEPLRLSARVVWCTSIGSAFQIGALFDDISEEQESFLEMFLQFLDGTLAPRGVSDQSADDGDGGDDADLPPSPDAKDDPFRS